MGPRKRDHPLRPTLLRSVFDDTASPPRGVRPGVTVADENFGT